ncbi:MAG: hypothetical protein DRJ38_00280 [Thermoprotei archaeon]|nr:MAG: hypothetical protein DRJ38_00280 [Thermoprotei archaeon]
MIRKVVAWLREIVKEIREDKGLLPQVEFFGANLIGMTLALLVAEVNPYAAVVVLFGWLLFTAWCAYREMKRRERLE